MRLFERINRRGAVLQPLATPREPLDLRDVRKAVRHSVRVVADDCAAWCADDPEQWRATANHNPGDLLGPLRLPFDSMWFEWVFPPSPRTDGTQFAAWITADDPQEYEHAPVGTAQVLTAVLFTARGSTLHYSPVVIGLSIDADGNCLGFDSNSSVNSDYSEYTRGALIPALAAIGFMNCRNVEVTASTPPERAKRPSKRKRSQRKRLQPLRHHTIVLPTRGHRQALASAQKVRGDAVSLHKVRGHFKTYAPDAPLMGKHTGTYWWHPTIRGMRDQGVIRSSYRVGPGIRDIR